MYHDTLYTVSMKTQNLVQNISTQKPYIPDAERKPTAIYYQYLEKKTASKMWLLHDQHLWWQLD